jgi:salicylate hydroxylase
VAHVLCSAGHSVRVLEKLPALGTPAGGLRVPPNMSKILKKWAGANELAKTAVLNVATPWYNRTYHVHVLCRCAANARSDVVSTGERMGTALWRPAVMAETGGDFLLMKVRSLHA